MTNIDKEVIINEINRQNPWWAEDSILAEDPNKPIRNIYPLLKKKILETNLITAIVGLRRIGKTTIVKQIINDLLRSSYERRNILYFSFEEFTLSQFPQLISFIIEYQVKKYPKTQLYFFFDEIQYVNLWNAVLKKYIDMYPNIKFVVTGSSSLFVKTSARETLAGRIQETIMHPLGFSEYLSIQHQMEIPETKTFDCTGLRQYKEVLLEKFYEYLTFGEFPYLPKLQTIEDKKEYVLQWVIGKILDSDLPKMQRVIRGTELISLGNILIAGSGQLVELQNLASDLGISRTTLSVYLDLLEKTHLIGSVFNRGVGFRTQSVRQRKIYATSVNAVVLKNTSGPTSESFAASLGKIIETFVYNYLARRSSMFYFWRKRQIHEINFIQVEINKEIPIEVKYQINIKPDDLANLLYYCRKEKLSQAIIVTKDIEKIEKIGNITIRYVPAYCLV